MKKLLLVAAILTASFNSYSQEKPKTDSTDIPLISIKDLELTLADLGDKISHNNFVLIQQAFQQVLTDAIKRKQQSIKSPKK